jgi:hypothetical protein
VADNAEFLNLVRTAFPVEPLPVQFFLGGRERFRF